MRFFKLKVILYMYDYFLFSSYPLTNLHYSLALLMLLWIVIVWLSVAIHMVVARVAGDICFEVNTAINSGINTLKTYTSDSILTLITFIISGIKLIRRWSRFRFLKLTIWMFKERKWFSTSRWPCHWRFLQAKKKFFFQLDNQAKQPPSTLPVRQSTKPVKFLALLATLELPRNPAIKPIWKFSENP